jgi:hypothetical protein
MNKRNNVKGPRRKPAQPNANPHVCWRCGNYSPKNGQCPHCHAEPRQGKK